MPLRRILLLIILALYMILGVLYAVRTPAWQAPDEPAHYNYIRFIATTGDFPVLQMGDYPHSYLEEIKSRKFPPDLSIDPIRYEFHQPPAYYVLLTPLFSAVRGALLPLRLASVLLGAGVVLLAYAIARRLYPERAALALGTAAFVAFLPQHLATVSQVGNDVLAELLFAGVLYVLVGWVLRAGAREQGSGIRDQESGIRRQGTASGRWTALTLGLLLGLILITKTTAYIAVPLAGGVLVWRWWRERAGARRIVVDALLVAVPALLLALPWYARDVAIYGWPDFLGLARHDQIVVGQTRTGEFLAQVGWNAYLRRAVEFTFKSFWGVFGWLGVFMDSRVYFLTAMLSLIAAGGLVLRLANRKWPLRVANDGHPSSLVTRHSSLVLLAISALLTLLTYAWYNTQFVQHQGRYLFTALIPIALAFALGWEAALWPRAGRILAAALMGLAVVLAAWGVLSHTGLPKWPLMITAVLAAGLFLASWLPRKLQPLWFASPYGFLVLLDLYALFKAIGPQLAR